MYQFILWTPLPKRWKDLTPTRPSLPILMKSPAICWMLLRATSKNTSLFEEISMVNPTNTYELDEDTKMIESSVDEKIIENNTLQEVSPSTRVFPDVLIDSESQRKNSQKLRL